MELPHYPGVGDNDDFFGFKAAQKRAEEAGANGYEEPKFIQHRVFLNQVDTFNSKLLASYLTDQVYGAVPGGEGGEEAEGEEMPPEEATPRVEMGPPMKYEVIGTLQKSFHKKTEDILFTVNESDENFTETIMKCGFVVYDITHDRNEIPKALATLVAIENEIEKMKELGPKTFKNIKEQRIFILISSVMTWARSKPIDPEDPTLPFTESDYKKRRPHPNYKDYIELEKEVVMTGRKNKDKLKTYVVASGIIYGMEEEDLTCLFKLAWYNEKELPIFRPGKSVVPLIHIKDLAKVIHGITIKKPDKQYLLAVEQTAASFKQVMKALSKAMGSGRTKDVSAEEAFLYGEMTQTLYERYTLNLTMEPGTIVEDLAVEWQNELNLAENMGNIVNEFKKTRALKPMRIILHGPPAVGKTQVGKQLANFYGLHYFTVKSAIEDVIRDYNERITVEQDRVKAKEEKEKAMEAAGGAGDDEGGEAEEEEEEEVNIEELTDQLKEIETAMEESENGKLPDEQVIQIIKTLLGSNRCQNQGYILDGYPKTIEQAKSIFGGGEGEEEAADEEGGGEEGEATGNKLLPDLVISLEATDQFVCDRIMALPEEDIQGTHYTEEGMLRRLAEFHANNTEDNTVLNFFNEIEIHPMLLNAMEDNMETIMQKIKLRLGNPLSFGLTPDEEEELIRLEEEKRKLEEKEARLMRELLEKEAVADHQEKMEKWTALLEQLQLEEEKMLAAHGEPLRHYLIRFVFPTLCKGLLEVARMKPDDPVDFLAEYLFRENPEGHMFDPAYTREGKKILETYLQKVHEDISRLA